MTHKNNFKEKNVDIIQTLDQNYDVVICAISSNGKGFLLSLSLKKTQNQKYIILFLTIILMDEYR